MNEYCTTAKSLSITFLYKTTRGNVSAKQFDGFMNVGKDFLTIPSTWVLRHRCWLKDWVLNHYKARKTLRKCL